MKEGVIFQSETAERLSTFESLAACRNTLCFSAAVGMKHFDIPDKFSLVHPVTFVHIHAVLYAYPSSQPHTTKI